MSRNSYCESRRGAKINWRKMQIQDHRAFLSVTERSRDTRRNAQEIYKKYLRSAGQAEYERKRDSRTKASGKHPFFLSRSHST